MAATHLTQMSASYLVAVPGRDDFVTAGKLAFAVKFAVVADAELTAMHSAWRPRPPA